MSNIVRSAQKQIVTSKSGQGAFGKGLVVAGGTGLGLTFLAGIIPFVSLPMLLIVMVIAGILLWE